MKTWTLSTPAGQPQNAWLRLPLPAGPYILLPQHEEALRAKINGLKWEEAERLVSYKLELEANLEFGCHLLANINGKASIVGAWLDTSD